MKKFLLLVSLFILSNASLWAMPAYPRPIDYKLPDGTTITIILKGDETIRWAQTPDGFSLLITEAGFFDYAKHSPEGDLVPSGIRASNISQRSSTEQSFLTHTQKGLNYSDSQKSMFKSIRSLKAAQATQAFPTTGNRKLVCILMGFTDVPFTKTKSDFYNLFNQVNYNTNGATGSVKDFYAENSYGQFNLTVDVYGPYSASSNMRTYGRNVKNDDFNPRALITEAVIAADAEANYANYDNDGDGIVDGVYVIYAGYGEEAGGSADAIWAHAWSISPQVLDGKTISKYSCSAELRGNSGSTLTAIGVICHEFGHVLGAPDYYDTNYETGGDYSGTGDWDLMAGGSWNNNGVTPAHHNAYTKIYYYNWAQAQTLTNPGLITMQNASEYSNSFYRINTATPGEFFLLENREKHRFDSAIPGSGMIIYHVHEGINTVGNQINATHPQHMYPVSANASVNPSATPSTYGNINSPGCAWPGTTQKKAFTDSSFPSMMSWNGTPVNKPLTSIARNPLNKTVVFNFMGGDPNAVHTLTYLAGANGTITGELNQFIPHKTDASEVLAVPNPGYVFKKWNDNNTENPRTDKAVEMSQQITAIFSKICSPVTVLPYLQDFNASTESPDCWEVTDHVGKGYMFSFGTHSKGLRETTGNYGIIDSDAAGEGSLINSDLISPVFDFTRYSNIIISFKHFFERYQLSTVSLSYTTDNGLNWNTLQTYTADTPNPSAVSLSLPELAGINNVQFKWNYNDGGEWEWFYFIDDISITGTPRYLLSYSAGANGTIEGNLNQIVETGENGTTVTAIANEGFLFDRWSDGVTSNPRTDMMVKNDLTVIALYTAITYNVTFMVSDKSERVAGYVITINGNNLVSDEEGKAVIQLANGNYTFTVSINGIEKAQGNVLIAGSNQTVTITLITSGVVKTQQPVTAMPNPFINNLVIEGAASVKLVQLFSINGIEMVNHPHNGSSTINLNTQSMAKGVYLLTIQLNNGEKIVRKLIKK